MDADRRVADLAAQQHAVVGRQQVLDAGMSRATLKRRLAQRRLEPLLPGVYVMPGAPPSWRQALMAAVIAGGPLAVASHRAAGRLWGVLEGEQPLEVTVPLSRAPRLRHVAVHRSTDLTPEQSTVRYDIPVTDPLRTMVDLGAVLSPDEVETALDRALVARLVTIAAVEKVLDQLARCGRSGCGVLRRLLDDRALGDQRPDGLLEPRMARVLQEAGLPPAAFQHVVRAPDGAVLARVDFAYPDWLLAIEVDGWSAHATPKALQADLERQNRLVQAGWTVLRFTWHDVVRRPAFVADAIRAFLARSGLTP